MILFYIFFILSANALENNHSPLEKSGAHQVTPSKTNQFIVPKSNQQQALLIIFSMAIGIALNTFVVIIIIVKQNLRRMTSAFIIHHTLLGICKELYCIPFVENLLSQQSSTLCDFLGGSYVVLITTSVMNMIAMVCCEVYFFGECNIGNAGRGSICCVYIVFMFIYVSAIIIHLGPTIIAGAFEYNKVIGNCTFIYGTVASYVAHIIWITVMILALLAIWYYLILYWKLVKSNEAFRLTSLVRASVDISRGKKTAGEEDIQKLVETSLNRATVIFLLTVIFVICWFPLLLLTLSDPNFSPSLHTTYSIFTIIAYSNSTFDPLVFLIFDKEISIAQFICVRLCNRQTYSTTKSTPRTPKDINECSENLLLKNSKEHLTIEETPRPSLHRNKSESLTSDQSKTLLKPISKVVFEDEINETPNRRLSEATPSPKISPKKMKLNTGASLDINNGLPSYSSAVTTITTEPSTMCANKFKFGHTIKPAYTISCNKYAQEQDLPEPVQFGPPYPTLQATKLPIEKAKESTVWPLKSFGITQQLSFERSDDLSEINEEERMITDAITENASIYENANPEDIIEC